MASVDTTLLYVAIDFGTTFSGYALQFKGKKNIAVNHNWGKEAGFESYKVPTCVVTDELNNFVAFGYEAQHIYSDNEDMGKPKREEDNDDDDSEDDDSSDPSDTEDAKTEAGNTPKRILHYYDEFKMELQKEKKITTSMTLKAFDGHECPAIDIFAMALRFLKKHLLDNMKAYTETIPKEDEITWVLTVPAIWSDGAKQFMRKCAVKAGLVSKDTSDNLKIALEPEAASLYCRTLPLQDFQVKENAPKMTLKEGLPQDSCYLVVDCGGGTVDVTAHHYKKGGDICELYAASGGGWGGRNINDKFEKKVNQVLGKEMMETFKQTYASSYLDRKVKFEKEKRGINFKNEKVKYTFICDYEFIKMCEERSGKDIQEIIKQDQGIHGVRFTNGGLVFEDKVLLDIFTPSVNKIKKHIINLIGRNELKEIKYIYLVGGFSDCSLLQSVIQQEFRGKNIQIILAPYEANLAVVKGAVLFGSNPHAISSRRTRCCYCTDADQSVHPSKRNRSTRRSGRKTLQPIVRQNVEIYNDDCIPTTFYPFNLGNIFKLYHYQNDARKFTTDGDVGVIDIKLSNVIGSNCTEDTKISIYLYFGSTELHITARNDKTMKSETESFDCLQDAESDTE